MPVMAIVGGGFFLLGRPSVCTWRRGWHPSGRGSPLGLVHALENREQRTNLPVKVERKFDICQPGPPSMVFCFFCEGPVVTLRRWGVDAPAVFVQSLRRRIAAGWAATPHRPRSGPRLEGKRSLVGRLIAGLSFPFSALSCLWGERA